MAKTIIDVILEISLDDSPSNLAAATLFNILANDVIVAFMVSPWCPHFSTGTKVEGILRQSADVEEVERRVQDYEQASSPTKQVQQLIRDYGANPVVYELHKLPNGCHQPSDLVILSRFQTTFGAKWRTRELGHCWRSLGKSKDKTGHSLDPVACIEALGRRADTWRHLLSVKESKGRKKGT